eukprot:3000207-Pleurochrysis_carterae.AAC.1
MHLTGAHDVARVFNAISLRSYRWRMRNAIASTLAAIARLGPCVRQQTPLPDGLGLAWPSATVRKKSQISPILDSKILGVVKWRSMSEICFGCFNVEQFPEGPRGQCPTL